MTPVDALRLLLMVVRLGGAVEPQFMADVVAQAEEVYLPRVEQPSVVLAHAQQRQVERLALIIQQLEMVVALMSAGGVGGSSAVLHLSLIDGGSRCRVGFINDKPAWLIVIGKRRCFLQLHHRQTGEANRQHAVFVAALSAEREGASVADIAEVYGRRRSNQPAVNRQRRPRRIVWRHGGGKAGYGGLRGDKQQPPVCLVNKRRMPVDAHLRHCHQRKGEKKDHQR